MKYFIPHENDILKQITVPDKSLVLCLDYDGTLVPLASVPEAATPGRKVLGILKELIKTPCIHVCLVTGRAMHDIRQIIPLHGMSYIASHGLEILSNGNQWIHPVAIRAVGNLKKMKSGLRKKLREFSGTMIEDKRLSVCVHYRNSPLESVRPIRNLVRNLAQEFGLTLKSGKKVVEAGAFNGWNKGKGIMYWSRNFLEFGPKIFFFAGDDRTDEDAFKALKRKGVTAFVGHTYRSQADYRFRNHTELINFLKKLSIIAG